METAAITQKKIEQVGKRQVTFAPGDTYQTGDTLEKSRQTATIADL